MNLVDVLYDQRKLLVVAADAPLPALFAEEEALAAARAAAPAAPSAAAAQLGLSPGAGTGAAGVSVSGAGGSSGRSTTMIGGVEWSATGRSGASLANISMGGGSFARAAAPRVASRLRQMAGGAWAARWAEAHAPPPSWHAWLAQASAEDVS